MSNLLISRFYWICIFLCVPCSIKAQQAYQSYADSLYHAGNYACASLEYERIVFMSNDPVISAKAVLMKVECLKQLKKYHEAQQYIEQHLTAEAGDSLEHVLEYQAALNAYLGGNFKDAYFNQVYDLSLLDDGEYRIQVSNGTESFDKKILINSQTFSIRNISIH